MIVLLNESLFYSSNMLVLFFEFYGVVIKAGHIIKSSKSEGFYKRFDRAPRPIVTIKVSKVKK